MSVSLSMVGFVDDRTGQTNSFINNDQSRPKLLCNIMQLDAQLWNDLLWLSGGKLELSKCFYHHIHLKFADDGSATMKAGHFGQPVTLHNELEEVVTIPAKSVYQSHKTLGHHKSPAGNNSTQLRILRASSNAFAKLVSTSPCNRIDSWFF